MTLGQMQREMTSTEWELQMGLEMLKQVECPSCGVEPRDMMDYETVEVKCPVCSHKWSRVRHFPAMMNGS